MLIPLGRPGTPEEAAGGVFFLCSPWSNYVHGQVLNITGGQFTGYDDVSTEHVITVVAEADLEDLLPLLRGYCDFYEVDPPDDALLALSRALIADPEREGLQLIAREPERHGGRLRDASTGPGRRSTRRASAS